MMKRLSRVLTALLLAASAALTLTGCASSGGSSTAAPAAASTVDTILSVGTTQAFSDEAVPEADIETILSAGLASESAINQQPWFLVAITDQKLMEEISASSGRPGGAMPGPQNGTKPAFPDGGSMPEYPQDGVMPASSEGASMPEAPAEGTRPEPSQGGAPAAMSGGGAKASLGDSPLAVIVYMDGSTSSPNPAFDCGLAAQNMYIAAASLGYGVKIVSSPTMALNGANHDQICEKLGVDPSLTAVAVLLIGKPDNSVDGVSGATVRAGLSEKASIVG